MTIPLYTLTALLGLLFPVGVVLWAAGLGRPKDAAVFGPYLFIALALGIVGFFAEGFALAFGGVAGLYPALGELTVLHGQWTPLAGPLGPGWVLAGGSGFFLAVGDDAGAYALFTFHAAVLLAFLSIITASWAGRVRPLAFTVLVVIFAWLIYPLAASWAWGGGWLAALGHTRGLGHGFIDPGGAGVVQLMAGAVVLGGSLLWGRLPKPATLATGRDGADAELPPLALAGALTMGMGWLALLAGDALLVGASLPQVLVNAVTSAGWATATAMGYMGFTTGRADGAMAARGMLAGIFAASAAAAFVSPPAAALIGAVAGLLVCLSTYAVAHSLRLDDPLHAVAVHGVSGLWGLVALGLFAEGRTGAGWNGVGLREYLGGVGQGVTGLLPAAGFVADPAQLVAQLVGAGVLVTWALTPALVLVKVVQRWANAREAVSLASHDEGAA